MSTHAFQWAPPEDRQHFFPCAGCGEMIDARDLGEVFEHEHNDAPKLKGKYKARRIKSPGHIDN